MITVKFIKDGVVLATDTLSDAGGTAIHPFGSLRVSRQVPAVNDSAVRTVEIYTETTTWQGVLFELEYRPRYYYFYSTSEIIYTETRSESFDGGTPSEESFRRAMWFNVNPYVSSIDYSLGVWDASVPFSGMFVGSGKLLRERINPSTTNWNRNEITYTYSDYEIQVRVGRIFTGLPIRNGAGTGLLRGASGLILVDA